MGAADSAESYEARFGASAELARRAARSLAGGLAHESWYTEPFPLGYASARGCAKLDISGNEFIDYWMGHGALLFGHAFPPIVAAVEAQARRGFHLGGPCELQARWAEEVCRLVPSAERVRFTASGTEATLLALRVARAFTRRSRVVRLDGHYHGWHDEAMAHFVDAAGAGLLPRVEDTVLLHSIDSLDVLCERLQSREVACVILEPGGGSSGSSPVAPHELGRLREATRASGTLLVFDEVVSGFRWGAGGAQAVLGVLPDLTALGKILTGGLPGGALAGPARIMSLFDAQAGRRALAHGGTFNANPITAAAGVASLEHAASGEAQAVAAARAVELAERVNAEARRRDVDLAMCATSSVVHFQLGARAAGIAPGPSSSFRRLAASNARPHAALRRALLLEGVDMHTSRGWLSSAHGGAALEFTARAFGRAMERMATMRP